MSEPSSITCVAKGLSELWLVARIVNAARRAKRVTAGDATASRAGSRPRSRAMLPEVNTGRHGPPVVPERVRQGAAGRAGQEVPAVFAPVAVPGLLVVLLPLHCVAVPTVRGICPVARVPATPAAPSGGRW